MESEDFSQKLHQVYQEALAQADDIIARARQMYQEAEVALEKAQDIRQQAERDAHQWTQEYILEHQTQIIEAAQTEKLRELARVHLKAGHTPQEISDWLHVSLDVSRSIQHILNRNHVRSPHEAKVRYETQGRSGHIVYQHEQTHFKLWWEFAFGKNALAILEMPPEETWESHTGLPRDQRIPVLTFIAERIVEDKLLGEGSYVLGESVITFYRTTQT